MTLTDKQKYIAHCKTEASIPIFSQYWWLDATCGENKWEVVILEKNNSVIASMPYYPIKKRGLLYISQPPLTQILGPWVKPFISKYAKALEQEKKILQDLFHKLPKHTIYQQSWHHQQTNWLPLHWMSFSQKSGITYRLPNLEEINTIWDGFQANIRTDIRKAEKNALTIKEDASIDDFLALNKKVFIRQKLPLPYNEELVKSIDSACEKNKSRKIFIAIDSKGRHHAGVYIVWDSTSAYYIMGGGDPELRNSGATSFCMWEAIKFSATVTKSFDFEGSMIESVERFFRAFGAQQTSYNIIYKNNSKLLEAFKEIKSLFS